MTLGRNRAAGDTLRSRLFRWWKGVAQKIGEFQARLLLGLFYLIVLAPFAIVVRTLADPLAIGRRARRGWLPMADTTGSPLERALLQF